MVCWSLRSWASSCGDKTWAAGGLRKPCNALSPSPRDRAGHVRGGNWAEWNALLVLPWKWASARSCTESFREPRCGRTGLAVRFPGRNKGLPPGARGFPHSQTAQPSRGGRSPALSSPGPREGQGQEFCPTRMAPAGWGSVQSPPKLVPTRPAQSPSLSTFRWHRTAPPGPEWRRAPERERTDGPAPWECLPRTRRPRLSCEHAPSAWLLPHQPVSLLAPRGRALGPLPPFARPDSSPWLPSGLLPGVPSGGTSLHCFICPGVIPASCSPGDGKPAGGSIPLTGDWLSLERSSWLSLVCGNPFSSVRTSCHANPCACTALHTPFTPMKTAFPRRNRRTDPTRDPPATRRPSEFSLRPLGGSSLNSKRKCRSAVISLAETSVFNFLKGKASWPRYIRIPNGLNGTHGYSMHL